MPPVGGRRSEDDGNGMHRDMNQDLLHNIQTGTSKENKIIANNSTKNYGRLEVPV